MDKLLLMPWQSPTQTPLLPATQQQQQRTPRSGRERGHDVVHGEAAAVPPRARAADRRPLAPVLPPKYKPACCCPLSSQPSPLFDPCGCALVPQVKAGVLLVHERLW